MVLDRLRWVVALVVYSLSISPISFCSFFCMHIQICYAVCRKASVQFFSIKNSKINFHTSVLHACIYFYSICCFRIYNKSADAFHSWNATRTHGKEKRQKGAKNRNSWISIRWTGENFVSSCLLCTNNPLTSSKKQ